MFFLKTSSTDIVQSETVDVRFGHNHRTKRIIHGPLGPMREIESTGVNKSRISINAVSAIAARGGQTSTRSSVWEAKILNLPSMLRRVQPVDVDELAARDRAIGLLMDELNHAREQRAAFVGVAWRRATPVLSATAARMADEQAAARKVRA